MFSLKHKFYQFIPSQPILPHVFSYTCYFQTPIYILITNSTLSHTSNSHFCQMHCISFLLCMARYWSIHQCWPLNSCIKFSFYFKCNLFVTQDFLSLLYPSSRHTLFSVFCHFLIFLHNRTKLCQLYLAIDLRASPPLFPVT